jgi:hypothetical protein
MASKIGRVIPLVISGVVLAGFLINFKHFGLNFRNHFEYGAGSLQDDQGLGIPAPLIANIYLHLSFLFLFIAGILLFANYKRVTKRGFLVISFLMLFSFLLRPVITLTSVYFNQNYWLDFMTFPTLKGQLIGIISNSWRYNLETRLQNYLTGIVLLLLLLINVVMSFLHRQDPIYAQRKQQQRDFLNQQAQARQSAWSAQQQIQAQALPQMPMPVQQQGAPSSLTQELERLQQMYQSGVLTEAEFIAAKQRIIGG